MKRLLRRWLSNNDSYEDQLEAARQKKRDEGKARYEANAGKRLFLTTGDEVTEYAVADSGVFLSYINKSGKSKVERGSLMGTVAIEIDYDKPVFLTWEYSLDSLCFVESASSGIPLGQL